MKNDQPTRSYGFSSTFIMSLSLLPILVIIVSFFGAADGFEMMRMTFTLGMATVVLTILSGMCMGLMKDQDDWARSIMLAFLAMACFRLASDPTLMGGEVIGWISLFVLYVTMTALIVRGILSASKRPYDTVENVYHRTLAIQAVVILMSAIPFALLKHVF